jgi:cyclase
MVPKRIIARLDIKGDSLVKGLQLEGLRKIGSPQTFAQKYYEESIDEVVLVDVVASLYSRNHIYGLISYITSELRVPVTVIGGIRSLSDAKQIFGAGADKIGINSHATRNPQILKELSDIYGSQAVVSSVEAKFVKTSNDYFLYTESGRNNSNIRLGEWFDQLSAYEIGEVLVTSVDKDGMNKGPDLELVRKSREYTPLPLIYCGGISNEDDALAVLKNGVDGIALGSALHYGKVSIHEIKKFLSENDINVRIEKSS